jgi:hypothetical protein
MIEAQNETAKKFALRDVIWVTNKLPSGSETIFHMGAPGFGPCIPYYINCKDDLVAPLKEAIAMHFVEALEDHRFLESSSIAGMQRGQLNVMNVRNLCGLEPEFYMSTISSPISERDHVTMMGINPVHITRDKAGQQRITLWGKDLYLNGLLLRPLRFNDPDIEGERSVTIAALLKYDVNIE